jgi:hypothetical protein
MTKITEMDLVRKGRLSVQRVDEKAWDAISLLTKEGGWEEMNLKSKKSSSKKTVKGATAKTTGRRGRGAKGQRKDDEEGSEKDEEGNDEEKEPETSPSKTGRKRKALEVPDEAGSPARRSTRAKR